MPQRSLGRGLRERGPCTEVTCKDGEFTELRFYPEFSKRTEVLLELLRWMLSESASGVAQPWRFQVSAGQRGVRGEKVGTRRQLLNTREQLLWDHFLS